MASYLSSRHIKSSVQPRSSLYWASLIGLMWLISVVATFTLVSAETPLVYWLWAVLARTFLHTGLFIITHEAIHRNISGLQWINDAFGYVTSWLYALLPYRLLAQNHRLHHRFPATEQDPDYHNAGTGEFWPWYIQFMKTYQTGGQVWVTLVGISLVFGALMLCQIPVTNLIFFWIVPMVLSSLQLFTFGIFLPHRPPNHAPDDGYGISSIHLPVFWSLITCYHFGYHQEHHLNPHLPWYQLPQVYRDSNVSRSCARPG